MKILFLILIVLLCFLNSKANLSFLKKSIDTTYIKDYSKKLMVTAVIGKRNFYSAFTAANSNKSFFRYQTNVPGLLSIAIDYKWIALEGGIRLPFFTERGRAKQKTFQSDLRFSSTGKRFWFSIFFSGNQGLYATLKNKKRAYYTRSDVYGDWIGMQLFYQFNRTKYSQLAALYQTEKQLKTAGTFLCGASTHVLNLYADSILIPKELDKNLAINNFINSQFVNIALGLHGGYAHTQVLNKNWFINASFIPGILFQTGSYNNKNINTLYTYDNRISGLVDYRLTAGFSQEEWFGGFAWHAIHTFKPDKSNSTVLINFGQKTIRIYIGKRFSLKKKKVAL